MHLKTYELTFTKIAHKIGDKSILQVIIDYTYESLGIYVFDDY